MKYLFLLIFFLLVPVLKPALAESAMITNNITDSTVNQYILINCQETWCESWLSGFFQNNQENEDQEDDDNNEEEVIQEKEFAKYDIRINEIMSAPETGEKEWVELYNTTDEDILLEDWQLEEGAGQKSTLFGTIASKGYLVFEKSSLNNSGDVIILKDKTGKIIDQVVYGDWNDGDSSDNYVAPSKGNSLILWQDSYVETEKVTRGLENIFEKEEIIEEEGEVFSAEVGTQSVASEEKIVLQYSDQICFSEILPNPDGSDDFEWIELYNFSDQDLNLFGWSLADSSGVPFEFSSSQIIKANDYLVLDKEQTKINLNNSGDSLKLFDPEGQEICNMSYEKSTENKSWSLLEGLWQETVNLTPGEKNIQESPQPVDGNIEQNVETQSVASLLDEPPAAAEYQKVSLQDIRNLPAKTKVQVTGQVSVLPGTFSKNVMYLSGSGLQVYYNQANWPELSLGEYVEVKGYVTEINKETRVNINEINKLNQVEDLIPNQISSSLISEAREGWLVQLEGQYLQKDGSKLFFSDSDGEFIVYLKKNTVISAKEFVEGQKYVITGVISQTEEEYRLMPRSQVDFSLIKTETEKNNEPAETVLATGNNQKNKVMIFLFSGLAVLVLFNLIYWFLRKYNIHKLLNFSFLRSSSKEKTENCV